jgi:hypothetical protein
MAREKRPLFKFKLRGKTAVFIDWGNVYHWKDKLEKEVDPQKLFNYLKSYKEIKDIRFYYGSDHTHPASKEFLKGIFKAAIKKFKIDLFKGVKKMTPNRRSGARL